MKRNLLIGLAALAAVTITSCQKDQVINQVPQEQAIEFGTYLGRDAMTKGEIFTTNDMLEDGFGVFAYYTGNTGWETAKTTATPNFMYNQQVKGTDTTNNQITTYNTPWVYSPVKYWPNNDEDKISFFAYAPYDNDQNNSISISESTVTGAPIIYYYVNDDMNNHIDLVYATAQTDKTKQTTTGTIDFNFFHALSRIGFKVEAMVDLKNDDETGATDDDTQTSTVATGTTITLKELSLSGDFHPSGNINLGSSTGTASTTGQTPTAAISNPYWTKTTAESKTFVILADDSNNQSNDDITVTTDKSDIKEDKYLMIIPQNFDNNKVTIKVIYDVTTTDSNNNANSSTITNTITESFNFNFEAGKAYSFNLHIGLTSVKFSANVESWDESDVAVNVPINTTPPAQNNN